LRISLNEHLREGSDLHDGRAGEDMKLLEAMTKIMRADEGRTALCFIPPHASAARPRRLKKRNRKRGSECA
jgi:hypothetical protein